MKSWGMLQTFSVVVKRSYLLAFTIEEGFSVPRSGASFFKQGETDMGDKGKKDKGKREQQKKAANSPKEKRKMKKEKKQNK